MIRISNIETISEHEKPIGQGTYSKVFMVEQEGTKYAVKKLKRATASRIYLENLHNEVSILEKQKHNNILKLLGK